MKIRLAGHNDRDGRAYGYSGRKGRLPLPFGALAYSDGFRVLAQADSRWFDNVSYLFSTINTGLHDYDT